MQQLEVVLEKVLNRLLFQWSELFGRIVVEQNEVEAAIVEEFEGDEIYESYGPSQLAESVVWEVWVKEGGEVFATRFLEEFADGSYKAYGSFQTLAVKLNKQHEATVQKAKTDEWARQKELVEIQSKDGRRAIETQAKIAAQAAALSNSRIELLVKLGIGVLCIVVGLGVASVLAISGAGLLAAAAASALFPIIGAACFWVFGKYPRFSWSGLPSASDVRTESPQPQPGTSI
ncbi:hypothetical protein [Bradyrhizobium sp. CCGB20]|uniref:hypothetical protein n=1 Tax=Bradyrhizobium sp. CCGB20 TaxID=2949633 RepID=UPI0020B269B5|nr:hypothetical protein [Bradyrhizobium sp. CCGB20]MCP3399744.1 hypothetical protein [Bradyrhizobium sp. CCGB20]